MPQRLPTRIDTSQVSPTVRRDERMRLQTPRVIPPAPAGLFGAEYTDSTDPESANHAFLADDAFSRARTHERTPMYHDHEQREVRENVARGGVGFY